MPSLRRSNQNLFLYPLGGNLSLHHSVAVKKQTGKERVIVANWSRTLSVKDRDAYEDEAMKHCVKKAGSNRVIFQQEQTRRAARLGRNQISPVLCRVFAKKTVLTRTLRTSRIECHTCSLSPRNFPRGRLSLGLTTTRKINNEQIT